MNFVYFTQIQTDVHELAVQELAGISIPVQCMQELALCIST